MPAQWALTGSDSSSGTLGNLIDEFNSSGDRTMVVPAEYVEVVVVKK
jgi:hypothetical protein